MASTTVQSGADCAALSLPSHRSAAKLSRVDAFEADDHASNHDGVAIDHTGRAGDGQWGCRKIECDGSANADRSQDRAVFHLVLQVVFVVPVM